ncbi:MAG: hypothetical protein WA765_19270 [Candidatus Acidiferrum sp.]
MDTPGNKRFTLARAFYNGVRVAQAILRKQPPERRSALIDEAARLEYDAAD